MMEAYIATKLCTLLIYQNKPITLPFSAKAEDCRDGALASPRSEVVRSAAIHKQSDTSDVELGLFRSKVTLLVRSSNADYFSHNIIFRAGKCTVTTANALSLSRLDHLARYHKVTIPGTIGEYLRHSPYLLLPITKFFQNARDMSPALPISFWSDCNNNSKLLAVRSRHAPPSRRCQARHPITSYS